MSEFSLDYFSSGVKKSYGFVLNKEKNSSGVSFEEIFRILVIPRKTSTYWYNFTSIHYIPGMIVKDIMDLYQQLMLSLRLKSLEK